MHNRLAVATWLVEQRGFSVIPLAARDKKPVAAWAAFQHARPSRDNLASWFGNGHERNLGIVCGAVSNVVVIDCDSPDAIAWADAHLPATPMVTKTAKGEHRFYRHPGIPVGNKARIKTNDVRIAIDIRGDGGFVVGPTSVHPSGVTYERVGTWPAVDELPVFEPTWIESEQPRPQASLPITQDREGVIRRARAYLEATPPAIEGQGGDTHTFAVACRLVRGFDLSDGDALDLLREWNSRCAPPWSDAGLMTKIEGARKYGDEPIGGKLTDSTRRPSFEQTAPVPDDAVEVDFDDLPPPAPAPGDLNFTDTGNAEYFAARHGQDVTYNHGRTRWQLFRGHFWKPDADAEIRRLAKAAMRQRFRDAAAIPELDARARAAKWAISSESRARIDALLYLAQAEIPIADSGEMWDLDPFLAGAPNCVIDLATGGGRPGRREDRITMSVGVPFDPAACCPRFEQFFTDIFTGDAALMDFVHRAIGYSLTGDTSEQCLFLCYGKGANGKGTLTQTLDYVLGDYSYTMPFATVELHQRSAIPNDLAALVGRRFVTASETNDGTRLNESRVKSLTGCDPITARFLHAEFFTFRPVGKYWLSVNHKPVVKDDSHAFWRRLRLIPFTQTFTVNPQLADELRAEGPGILAWIVRGCLAWRRLGLEPPAAVRAATKDYERDSDPLAAFIDEVCDLDADSQIRASELFEHYMTWAKNHSLGERERLTATGFGRKASERFEHERTRDGKVYKGVGRR